MLNWLKKLFHKPQEQTLHFKNPQAAFDYASLFLKNEMVEGNIVPCLIEDVMYTSHSGWIANISIPSISGRIDNLAAFPNNGDYRNLKGSLCAAYIGPKIPFGDGGNSVIIIAELKPELSKSGWKISRKFGPN